jgi:hypothetical protein
MLYRVYGIILFRIKFWVEFYFLKLCVKAAIELGGNILAEFFVFGTAIAIIIIEFVRSGRKQIFKETTVANRVSWLEANTHTLLETVEAYNTRFVEMNTVIVTQKSKIDDLINQISILDSKLNQKLAVQEPQMAKSNWHIGKLFQSKTLGSPSRISQASSDVTNSKLYQIAEETATMLMPFKKTKASVTQEPVIKPHKSKITKFERFFSSFLRY